MGLVIHSQGAWEGYCIEKILNLSATGVIPSHYRTHAGVEVDLVPELPDGQILGIEVKRTLSPEVTPA